MGSIGENLAFGAKYKPKRDVGGVCEVMVQ